MNCYKCGYNLNNCDIQCDNNYDYYICPKCRHETIFCEHEEEMKDEK